MEASQLIHIIYIENIRRDNSINVGIPQGPVLEPSLTINQLKTKNEKTLDDREYIIKHLDGSYQM